MYSWGNRLNTVFTFSLTVLSFIIIALAASSLILTTPVQKIETRLGMVSLVKLLPYKDKDFASFVFSLDADLRPVFNWNVKQLFVYISANYSTVEKGKQQYSDVILWDKIIRSPEMALLHYAELRNEYALVDKGNGLRNTTVTFKLNWDITPYAGQIFSQKSVPEQWLNITLPTMYKKPSPKENFNTYEESY